MYGPGLDGAPRDKTAFVAFWYRDPKVSPHPNVALTVRINGITLETWNLDQWIPTSAEGVGNWQHFPPRRKPT